MFTVSLGISALTTNTCARSVAGLRLRPRALRQDVADSAWVLGDALAGVRVSPSPDGRDGSTRLGVQHDGH